MLQFNILTKFSVYSIGKLENYTKELHFMFEKDNIYREKNLNKVKPYLVNNDEYTNQQHYISRHYTTYNME